MDVGREGWGNGEIPLKKWIGVLCGRFEYDPKKVTHKLTREVFSDPKWHFKPILTSLIILNFRETALMYFVKFNEYYYPLIILRLE